jgi:hypothetical protein
MLELEIDGIRGFLGCYLAFKSLLSAELAIKASAVIPTPSLDGY